MCRVVTEAAMSQSPLTYSLSLSHTQSRGLVHVPAVSLRGGGDAGAMSEVAGVGADKQDAGEACAIVIAIDGPAGCRLYAHRMFCHKQ